MSKSALDLFKQAYKGAVKQIAPMKVKPLKMHNIKDSKTLSPLADGANSLMTEAYKKDHPNQFENMKNSTPGGKPKAVRKTK